jgi:hypothetical protein
VQQRGGPAHRDEERGHADEQRRIDGRAPQLVHSVGGDDEEYQDEERLGEEAQQIIRTHVLPAPIRHCPAHMAFLL